MYERLSKTPRLMALLLLAVVLLLGNDLSQAQRPAETNGMTAVLLDWMQRDLEEAMAAFQDQARQLPAESSSDLLALADELQQKREQMHFDLERLMKASVQDRRKDDSTRLIGRYQLEEWMLPLSDFLQYSIKSFPGLSSGSLPELQPGRYTAQQIVDWRRQMETLAAYRHRECLRKLEVDMLERYPRPVLIAPAALNVLYTGIDNPLRVFGGAAKPESITLEGSGIRFDEASQTWYSKPLNTGQTTIRLNGRTADDRPVTGEAQFEARRVPDPVLYVGGRSDGVLVKSEIAGLGGISARNDDFFLETGYSIKGFELVYTPEYGSPVSVKTSGNKINDEMMDVLKRTRPGDRVLFRAGVEWPDGSIKTLSTTCYIR